MDKHKAFVAAKEPVGVNKVANKPHVDKSVTHFNWFARFETRQIPYRDLLKP